MSYPEMANNGYGAFFIAMWGNERVFRDCIPLELNFARFSLEIAQSLVASRKVMSPSTVLWIPSG